MYYYVTLFRISTMSPLFSLYRRLINWYGTRTVYTVSAIAVTLFAVGLFLHFTQDEVVSEQVDTKRAVSVARVSDMSNSAPGTLSVLGTVESTREARLVTESGGRVTAVNVNLGDSVGAGAVLATIENSRERAVVLQAQGSYEAALAGANAGTAGVATAERALAEAETSTLNVFRSAYTTSDSVIRNTADLLFADPDGSRPGLLIDGEGQAPALSNERVALGALLDTWKQGVDAPAADPKVVLDAAELNARRISVFLSTLATLYSNDTSVPADLASAGASLSTARAQIDGVLASISGARSGLIAAENALTQARISGQSGATSATDAQIKQALGSLRLAQANLEKTIIRSPISGTVQSVTLKEGSTVPMGSPAVIVSSEGSLEVVAYITENDLSLITVGDQVRIEGNVEGVVTELASAIDPTTKKIEMRIGIKGAASTLTNGQGVTVSLTPRTSADAGGATSTITLPIIALKMTPDGAVVFTIENGVLVSHPVTLGAILGERVVVEKGIETTWEVVTDARGLRAGEEVEVK